MFSFSFSRDEASSHPIYSFISNLLPVINLTVSKFSLFIISTIILYDYDYFFSNNMCPLFFC